jgi:hypothetical protein
VQGTEIRARGRPKTGAKSRAVMHKEQRNTCVSWKRIYRRRLGRVIRAQVWRQTSRAKRSLGTFSTVGLHSTRLVAGSGCRRRELLRGISDTGDGARRNRRRHSRHARNRERQECSRTDDSADPLLPQDVGQKRTQQDQTGTHRHGRRMKAGG